MLLLIVAALTEGVAAFFVFFVFRDVHFPSGFLTKIYVLIPYHLHPIHIPSML
jgi:hypothetical protein